ncbi:MAG: hypothetical protein DRI61_05720 [Chloroflexi bacterium]|nr:MAG: hypothetical protein DRI61_05720 [Chloroflexota bacterium]
MAFPGVIRISPYTLLRKERRLPVMGDVLVQPGTSVEASQVIAKGFLSDWVCLDVIGELNVSEDQLELFLIKKPGEEIEKGEELAVKKGVLPFTSYSYISPVSGRIVATGMGQVIIETVSKEVELKAGLKGTVKEIIPYYGAVVEGKGAVVETVWANGREGQGILRILEEGKTSHLRADDLDPGNRGFILVCGGVEDEKALEKAADIRVAGIVVGSLKLGLRKKALSMPYPIQVTEGFGDIPMSSIAFELFRGYEGQEASLLLGDSIARRPCVFIPVAGEIITAEASPGVLKVGSKVRGSRDPYRGKCGVVQELPRYEVHLESGYTVSVARVRLEDGEEVEIPLSNLELIDET